MTAHNRAAFDEQAALEELERLQQAIADSRRRRGETVDEFNAFVRSFGNPAPAPVRRPDLPSPAAVPPPAAAPFIFGTPERVEATDPADLPAGRPRSRPRQVPAGALVGAAALVVVAAVVMLTIWGGRTPSTPSPSPAARVTAGSAATPPAAASAPAVPGRTGGLQMEITSVRPVWVRVLADGQRAIERELKANERIPVHAVKTLAIRAGDAGALRVSIDGRDQGPLGRDGVIGTRTFTAGGTAPAPR